MELVLALGVWALLYATYKMIKNGLKYSYWFCWGMYQQARYGDLPKLHYKLQNGQWTTTWRKR